MYSKDHFAKQFRALGTDELVERLARRDLADEARAALADVLRERGHAGDELDGLVHQARKGAEAFLRETGGGRYGLRP